MIPDLSWLRRASWGKGGFVEDYLLLSAIVCQLKPRAILEVGTSTGLGAVVLAQAARAFREDARVWTVDVDQSRGRENVHLVPGIAGCIEFVQGRSNEVLTRWARQGMRFDLAFLDGDHSYMQARQDWELACALCPVVVLHDTTQFTGLQQLVNEIRRAGTHDVFQFVAAPGHRIRPVLRCEQFITGMTLVQDRRVLDALPAQAHRGHAGGLLPGHPEHEVPGLKGRAG